MVTLTAARALLRQVNTFQRAMDGPSTDAEVDAACEMRDAALRVLMEAAQEDQRLQALLQSEKRGLASQKH